MFLASNTVLGSSKKFLEQNFWRRLILLFETFLNPGMIFRCFFPNSNLISVLIAVWINSTPLKRIFDWTANFHYTNYPVVIIKTWDKCMCVLDGVTHSYHLGTITAARGNRKVSKFIVISFHTTTWVLSSSHLNLLLLFSVFIHHLTSTFTLRVCFECLSMCVCGKLKGSK